jgi:hypothetical protein
MTTKRGDRLKGIDTVELNPRVLKSLKIWTLVSGKPEAEFMNIQYR